MTPSGPAQQMVSYCGVLVGNTFRACTRDGAHFVMLESRRSQYLIEHAKKRSLERQFYKCFYLLHVNFILIPVSVCLVSYSLTERYAITWASIAKSTMILYELLKLHGISEKVGGVLTVGRGDTYRRLVSTETCIDSDHPKWLLTL
jgi:hypothetical protein